MLIFQTIFILFAIAAFLTIFGDGRKIAHRTGVDVLQDGANDSAFQQWGSFVGRINTCDPADLNRQSGKRPGVPKYNKSAMRWYRLAADQGDARNHYRLGDMHAYGDGVVSDQMIAKNWYRHARKQSDEDADIDHDILETEKFTIGLDCYQDGKFEIAFGEWEILARHGFSFNNARSQFRLGEMYKNGQGVKEDFVAAFMWYDIAASRGVEEAENSRDLLARRMTATQLQTARKLAREFASE
jgi:uncharacterized protein